jgi:hypothetical protein
MGENNRKHRNIPQGFPRRTGVGVGGTLLLLLLSTGCGNTIYAIQANSAASKLEEAKALGAEQYAPYEYYFAKAHLEKAQTEAGEADYSDASNLAETAEEYADKAIALTRDAHQGGGR